MFKRSLLLATLLLTAIAFFPSKSFASEGFVELTNRVGEDARCWAPSVLMQDQNYNILVSCRDIIYPGGVEVFDYVMWARPLSGGDPVRLGAIELGKKSFRTSTAYNALFVTKERSANPRTPEGPIVMQGTIQSIQLLDGSTTPRPTAAPGQSIAPEASDEPVVTPAPQGGVARFLAGGVITILGIAGLLFVIFIVMRK